MNILVIGCGVSGLTTGLCLLEAGHSVSIWAKDLHHLLPPTLLQHSGIPTKLILLIR